MAEVRNDITRLEDDLELLSSGLEQLEDKTERIFFIDEQCKQLTMPNTKKFSLCKYYTVSGVIQSMFTLLLTHVIHD